MADFCHFCSCKGGMWAQSLRPGEGQMPHAPHVTTAFFPEKHQTLHDLSLANCMHSNEMIIVDSWCMIFLKHSISSTERKRQKKLFNPFNLGFPK